MPTHSYTQTYIHTYFIDSNPPIIPYYQNFMDSKPPIIFYIIKIRLIGGERDGLDIIPTWNIPLYRWYCKRFPSHNSILKHQLKENLGFWHVRQLSYCVSAPNVLFYPWWSLCWESANWVSALPDQPIKSTKRVDGNARLQKQKQKKPVSSYSFPHELPMGLLTTCPEHHPSNASSSGKWQFCPVEPSLLFFWYLQNQLDHTPSSRLEPLLRWLSLRPMRPLF